MARKYSRSKGQDFNEIEGQKNPVYSKDAPRRSSKKGQNRRNFRGQSQDSRRSNRRDSKTEWTEVICDSCKDECRVPFKPSSDKPIFCDKCFNKNSKFNTSNKELEEINEKLDKIMKSLKIN